MSGPQQTPGRGDDERDEALDDAGDESLDRTDVDPTGNVVHNDPVAAKDDAAAAYGDEEEASPT